ncbi:MAG: hypothetical protein ABSF69_20455 [Polyangiaceae bacterium]
MHEGARTRAGAQALGSIRRLTGAVVAILGAGCGGSNGAAPSSLGQADASAADSGTPVTVSDPSKLGPYAVGHANYMLSDSATYARSVIASVWYPADPAAVPASAQPAQYPLDEWDNMLPTSTSTDWEALGYDPAYESIPPSDHGPFPLVVVSPGWSCDDWFYLYIGTRLASHGFVVAVLSHSRDGQWTWIPQDDVVTTSYNRAFDASFAITQLLLKNSSSSELLFGTVDPSKIAMSGHSLGGYGAYALGVGDDEVCDTLYFLHWTGGIGPIPSSTCAPAPADSRVKAVVTMDGFSEELRFGELARLSIPSLILGETIGSTYAYQGVPIEDTFQGLWNARPHAAIGRSDSYRVDLTQANHMSFTVWCDGLTVMKNLHIATPDGTSIDTDLASWPCVAQGTFDPTTNPATRETVTTYMVGFLQSEFGVADLSTVLTPTYATQNEPDVDFFASEACGDAGAPDGGYTYFAARGECEMAVKDPLDDFLTDESKSAPLPGFQIEAQGYIVAGAWEGYASPKAVTSTAADAGTTTISPGDFSTVPDGASELCIQGSIGAASDYGGAAFINVAVNQPPAAVEAGADAEADAASETDAAVDGAADGGLDGAALGEDGAAAPALQTVALGGSGLTIWYTNPGGSALRVVIYDTTGYKSPTGHWCANLSGLGGTETLFWSDFWGGVADGTQGCWNLGGNNPSIGTPIVAVELLAPGGNTSAVPYSMCLKGLAQAP